MVTCLRYCQVPKHLFYTFRDQTMNYNCSFYFPLAALWLLYIYIDSPFLLFIRQVLLILFIFVHCLSLSLLLFWLLFLFDILSKLQSFSGFRFIMRDRIQDTLAAHRNELVSLLSRFVSLSTYLVFRLGFSHRRCNFCQ